MGKMLNNKFSSVQKFVIISCVPLDANWFASHLLYKVKVYDYWRLHYKGSITGYGYEEKIDQIAYVAYIICPPTGIGAWLSNTTVET